MTAIEGKLSPHPVEVVRVGLQAHPAADLLSIIPVYGYTYVGRTEDWVGVTKGAYIPPDSIVDAGRPEFASLGTGKVRIKAKKLRGVVSFGLMVPVPDDTPLGEDWAERLGVEHYEPPLAHERKARGFSLGGDESPPPSIWAPKYDLDTFRRYHEMFVPGEPVVVTEKLDGANARFTYLGGRMHCGSRERWTRESCDYSHLTVDHLVSRGCEPEEARQVFDNLTTRPQKRNIWWQALRDNPGIEQLCREEPGLVVYSEIFGSVNAIKYGLPTNQLAVFDVLRYATWLDPEEARDLLSRHGVPMVPLLNDLSSRARIIPIPYDFETICAMAEGETLVPGARPGTIREGVVVSPLEGRRDRRGRVKMKVVSATFLERYR